jgi:hypothetical protein
MDSSDPSPIAPTHYRAGVWMAVVALTTTGAFGYAVVKGVGHKKPARKADAQVEAVRAGVADESAELGHGPEAARRFRERTLAATARLKESTDAETAALGRILERMNERTRATDERLLAALDAVATERFMKIDAMLANKDFAWQRDTAQEYGLAAKAATAVHGRLPQQLEKELSASDMERSAAEAAMSAFNRTWSLSGRVCRAHVLAAKADGALIDFLEKHAAEVEVAADGNLAFATDEGSSAYNKLLEESTAADAEVDAAVEALGEADAGR